MLTTETKVHVYHDHNGTYFLDSGNGKYVYRKKANTIEKYNGFMEDWCMEQCIPFPNDLGDKTVAEICGEDVEII
jgi:hypothetical protein